LEIYSVLAVRQVRMFNTRQVKPERYFPRTFGNIPGCW